MLGAQAYQADLPHLRLGMLPRYTGRRRRACALPTDAVRMRHDGCLPPAL
jgi:hypothetical protein